MISSFDGETGARTIAVIVIGDASMKTHYCHPDFSVVETSNSVIIGQSSNSMVFGIRDFGQSDAVVRPPDEIFKKPAFHPRRNYDVPRKFCSAPRVIKKLKGYQSQRWR